jgi:peptidoglycan hydrolase-like protein with peptidoglycan-binding domain
MKTWPFVSAAAMVLALSTTPLPTCAGEDVERLQKALKQNGHDPGPIDGINGPRTVSALKAYQNAQGLETTGRLDDATLAKLVRSDSKTQAGGDARPSPADPAQSGKTGANVGEGASYSRSSQK